MTTILDVRPGLAGMIARARESLRPDSRRTLDEHVTAAERLVSDVFGDLILWRLRGSDALWVRLADLAGVMEITQQAISTHIIGAEASGEIGTEDVRRGVRSEDVDPSSHKDCLWLTTSPTGVTTVTLRAARLLVMSCRGDRGVRFRLGIERLFDAASATERLALLLLLERQHAAVRIDDPRAIRAANASARLLRQCGDKAGALTVLRRAFGLPDDGPVSDPVTTGLAGEITTKAGVDPWTQQVSDYLERTGMREWTLSELLVGALGIEPDKTGEKHRKFDTDHLGRVLRCLGIPSQQAPKSDPRGRVRVYRLPIGMVFVNGKLVRG